LTGKFRRIAKPQTRLFTDTLDDVNGVATTIRKMTAAALKPKEHGGCVQQRIAHR